MGAPPDRGAVAGAPWPEARPPSGRPREGRARGDPRADYRTARAYPVVRRLSVILPVLNEAQSLRGVLGGLSRLRLDGHEVIVVDGGSGDDSSRVAEGGCDRVLSAPRGRASQMNAGAAASTGDALLFLHADTVLPERAAGQVLSALSGETAVWGRFDVRLSGRHPLLRVVERLMNLRSRLTGIATGDQAMFVRRDVFESLGGFPAIPLMEDVALSRLLRRRGAPACLSTPVITSSRRWEQRGILRTIVLMWRLRLAFALGADPARLRVLYERH